MFVSLPWKGILLLLYGLNIKRNQKGGVTDTYPSHACEYVSMTRTIAITMLLIFNISSVKLT